MFRTPAAADPPALTEDELHLWRFALGVTDPKLDRGLLGPQELRRADRYSNDLARNDYQSGRANLRRILGRYLGTEPESLTFTAGQYGKPALDAAIHPQPPQFSLSHSHGVGLLAVARSAQVGVDIEWHDPARDLEMLAINSFSARELAAWNRLEAPARGDSFFQTWVCKEAFIKATGRGLGYGLKRFDVIVGSAGASFDLPAAEGEWSLRIVDAGPGFSAAVVASGQMSFEIKSFTTSCTENGIDLLRMDEHNADTPEGGPGTVDRSLTRRDSEIWPITST